MAGDKIQTNYFSGEQGRTDFYISGTRMFAFVLHHHLPDEKQPKSKQLSRLNRVDC